MKLVCNYILAGQPTANDRVYSSEVMSKIVEYANRDVGLGRTYLVEGSPGPGSSISLAKVAAVATAFSIEDDRICCDADILETPSGKMVRLCQAAGGKLWLGVDLFAGLNSLGNIDVETLSNIHWYIIGGPP